MTVEEEPQVASKSRTISPIISHTRSMQQSICSPAADLVSCLSQHLTKGKPKRNKITKCLCARGSLLQFHRRKPRHRTTWLDVLRAYWAQLSKFLTFMGCSASGWQTEGQHVMRVKSDLQVHGGWTTSDGHASGPAGGSRSDPHIMVFSAGNRKILWQFGRRVPFLRCNVNY